MYTEISREKLLKRGYCCGLKCKNCPYDPCHIKDNTNLKKDTDCVQNPYRGIFSKINKTSHWDWDFIDREELDKIINKSS